MASRQDKAEWIIRQRTARARSVMEGTAELRGYPYPYLSIISRDSIRGPDRVTWVLVAAEVLRGAGWELISVADTGGVETCGILRRVQAPPPASS